MSRSPSSSARSYTAGPSPWARRTKAEPDSTATSCVTSRIPDAPLLQLRHGRGVVDQLARHEDRDPEDFASEVASFHALFTPPQKPAYRSARITLKDTLQSA